jgi:hypothetical protein
MDDESVYGRVLHRLAFGEAIRRGLLSDYQVAIVGVDNATYREWADRGEFVTYDGDAVTDARTLAAQIGLLRAIARFDLRRVVTFHAFIARAARFARLLPDVCAWIPQELRPTGSLWSTHVSGEMTSGERDRLLRKLGAVADDGRGVLSNARCLSEGVDVPTLDGVVFIDPRHSQVDVVQAVGRAIRRAEGKTHGTVILPVFIDETEDAEELLGSSAFNHVWQVVKALRAHDDELGEELDEIRRSLGRRASAARLPDKIRLDLPQAVGAQFARAFETFLIEQASAGWEFWLGLLEAFVDEHGHALVPIQHRAESGHWLGKWVHNQRTKYAAGHLGGERIAQLEALRGLEGEPIWVWDAPEAQWQLMYRRLLAYAEANGTARMPTTHADTELARWAARQRQSHRTGRLPNERFERLDALCPHGWSWGVHEDKFQHGLEHFRAYRERFASETPPPKKYVDPDDGYPTGRWFENLQRSPTLKARLQQEFGAEIWEDMRASRWVTASI